MSTNGASTGNGSNSSDGAEKPPVDRAIEFLVYAPVGLTLMAWQAVPKLVNEIVTRGCAQIGQAETKVRQARMIGQMVVTYGPRFARREVDRRVNDAVRKAGHFASTLQGVPGTSAPGNGSATGATRPTPARPPSGASRATPAASGEPDTVAVPPVEEAMAPPAPGSVAPKPAAKSRPTMAKPAPAPKSAPMPKPATAPKPAAAPSAAPAPVSVPAAADLPIPAYDGLSASQVVSRLSGLTPAELALVRTYETAGRGRKTVLVAIDRLLP